MSTSDSDVTVSSAVVALRTDIYERQTKGVLMSLDDIETLEHRVEDRNLFRSIGIFLLSGSFFLGLEKGVESFAGNNPVATALFVFCICGVLSAGAFFYLAHRRTKRIEAYKAGLFASNRLVSTNLVTLPTHNPTLKVVS